MARKKTEPDLGFISRMEKIIEDGGGQNEFARKAGLAQGTLRPYLHGAEPTRPQLILIAKASGRSLAWIMTGEEDQQNKVVAKIEPGTDKKRNRIKELGSKITQTDYSLKNVIEWMDEYFGKDPYQITNFILDIGRSWPSFRAFMEKKSEGSNPEDIQRKIVSGKNDT